MPARSGLVAAGCAVTEQRDDGVFKIFIFGQQFLVACCVFRRNGSAVFQQHIIQQKVLEEIIAVKTFLISDYQLLQLAHRYFPYKIRFVITASGHQYICRLIFVRHLKQVVFSYHLTVRR